MKNDYPWLAGPVPLATACWLAQHHETSIASGNMNVISADEQTNATRKPMHIMGYCTFVH